MYLDLNGLVRMYYDISIQNLLFNLPRLSGLAKNCKQVYHKSIKKTSTLRYSEFQGHSKVAHILSRADKRLDCFQLGSGHKVSPGEGA